MTERYRKRGAYVVTGGLGFIGKALVDRLLRDGCRVITLDSFSYAACQGSRHPGFYRVQRLQDLELATERHLVIQVDLAAVNTEFLTTILVKSEAQGVFHLAASTHVDRSLERDGQRDLVSNNVLATQNLLEACRRLLATFPAASDDRRRFVVTLASTDEVYGGDYSQPATEESAVKAGNVYAATKIASEQLALAYWRSFGVPAIIVRGCNVFGPYQHPEKFIPRSIGLLQRSLPVQIYGAGLQTRAWQYVDARAEELLAAFDRGQVGETYNLGCGYEITNDSLAKLLVKLAGSPLLPGVTYVTDRRGHDFQYRTDDRKITELLAGLPMSQAWLDYPGFRSALRATVDWYLSDVGRKWTEATGHDVAQRQGLSAWTDQETLKA